MLILKRIILLSFTALAFSVGVSAVNIIPQPSFVREDTSKIFFPSDRISVGVADNCLKPVVKVWQQLLHKVYEPGTATLPTGFTRIVSDVRLPALRMAGNRSSSDIYLQLDSSLSPEEYVLELADGKAVIAGGDEAGVWWGLQTMSQILIQSASVSGCGKSLQMPSLSIKDRPHFSYRGAMLDCCRYFFPVEDVKKFIDMMAIHKLNTFHWHLTDDQGWRVEIGQYPRLTEVGSIRDETKIGNYLDETKGYDGTPYGGFYTQKDIREIVSYAAERYITIIPEIEMPGHAVAALASYPWLGCTGEGYEVRKTWGVSDDVFCIGKESTFGFLENVLDEICEMFPGEYIHIGGDECPAVRWESCPDCQKRMEEEGLKEERQLQGYMLHRVEAYLNSKGRKIIGWDEILEGGVTPTATVMSWRGPEGGITAAGQGNHVVMSPNVYLYFDYYQTSDPAGNGEPSGIGGNVSLEKCYSFDPYDKLDYETRKYIKGIQANTWTEYIKTFDHIQHMDLPRFCALSEIAWSEEKSTYEDFLSRLENSMKLVYEYLGLVYSKYAFEGIE